MKAQVEQLQVMSETLESSGFSRHQSNAVIESVALAMETFSVTPEILETRLKEHTEQILKVLRGRDNAINNLQTDVRNLQNSMLALQRSMFRMMLAIIVTLIATALTLFGTLATQFPTP